MGLIFFDILKEKWTYEDICIVVMQQALGNITRMVLWKMVEFDTSMYSYLKMAFEEQKTG